MLKYDETWLQFYNEDIKLVDHINAMNYAVNPTRSTTPLITATDDKICKTTVNFSKQFD